MHSQFKIEQLTIDAIPFILPICNEELGTGFLTDTVLIDYMQNPKCQSLIAVDSSTDKIVGASISLYLSQSELKQFIHPSQYIHLDQSITKDENIGILKLIAIEKDSQKKGLGTQFIKGSFEFFSHNNIQTICAFAWESKTGINMKTIFDRYELTIMSRIPHFWTQDSLEQKYDCPECGKPPCKCTAVIFSKHRQLSIHFSYRRNTQSDY